MKYISNKNIAWLACFLLVGCQAEDSKNMVPDNALQVLAVDLENDKLTKAEVTSIDVVNVYLTDASHAAIADKATSTFKLSTTWSCTDAPLLVADPYKAYAYYPVEEEGKQIAVVNSTDGSHKVPVTVSAENTFEGKQSDYLYADQSVVEGGLTVSKSKKSVSFTMKHALAKVSFQVTKDASAVNDELTLTRVEIVSRSNCLVVGTGGYMALRDGALTNLTNGGQITLTGNKKLENTSNTSYISTLVAPMNTAEKVLSFRLTVKVGGEETGRVFETGTVTAPEGDLNWPGVKWEAGHHYVYKITVSKMGGVINGVSVYDWKKDSDQNTHVGI